MIATELQDCMFGTPSPVLSEINLGVLKEDIVETSEGMRSCQDYGRVFSEKLED